MRRRDVAMADCTAVAKKGLRLGWWKAEVKGAMEEARVAG